MAMQNSLDTNGGEGPKADDPDALTKSDILTRDKGKAPAEESAASQADQPSSSAATNGTQTSPVAQISSSAPHTEPVHDPAVTTRIQFKHPAGRIVRRFAFADPVRRIYEWLKAEPIEGREGQDFELINMGKNLIESLDVSIADAGLKNSTVMVEFSGGAEDEE